ncbi:MAG: LysM peptidoglycan-binding domain-containing protein [Rikenellaceae bacterium]
MKRLILTAILAFGTVALVFSITKSQVVVYINGEKYYIHTVDSGETITAIAEAYNVDKQILIDLNSVDLKAGENIKIPFETPKVERQKKMSGLRSWLTFTKHKVKSKETLYSISRKYEIPIETIMEDNPTIDPIALPLGYELLIRKKMTGTSTAEENLAEWESYQDDLNLTTQSDGYTYHIVDKGETIYSLSREHGIDEEEFIKLNNLQGGLKAGSIVKFPVSQESVDVEDNRQKDQDFENVVAMRSLRQSDTLKIALLLPLTIDNNAQRQFADFYKGFTMGLERVKRRWGRDIELTLFNTERDTTAIEGIVSAPEFEGTNLIVGPIYEDVLDPIIRYAEQNGVAVVSPLATLKETNSSVLFQLAPTVENKFDKVEDMLSSTKHVTLIYTQQTDSIFEQNIMSILGDRPYDKHIYRYEHPTVVAEKIQNNRTSDGDLTKFINNGLDNTIVIMSSTETDVDRVLSALSSAQLNIVARGGKMPKYSVLGNSEWSRYKNIDRSVLFKNNVVLLSSYHAKRDNVSVREFDSDYIEQYGAMPTLFTYRGFDTAMIFGEALYIDLDYNLEGRTYTPLQSQYRFKTDPTSGTHTNIEWIRVNYNNNYTITIE